jgi:hypothetical protein
MFDIDVGFGSENGYYGGDGEMVTTIMVCSLT